MLQFDTSDEIHQKLSGCICIYKGEPFLVYGAIPDEFPFVSGWIADKSSSNRFRVSVEDPDFNFMSLGERLGYMNVSEWQGCIYNEAIYMMRSPVRRSHQGLNSSNVIIFGLKGNKELSSPRQELEFGRDFQAHLCSNLTKTFNNIYPSISDVKELCKSGEFTSYAFSRTWAIRNNSVGPFEIMYKNNQVGYTEDFSRYVISDRYRFLRKEFMDKIHA